MSHRHDPFLDIVRWIAAELVLVGHVMVLAFPDTFAKSLPEGRLGARDGHFHVQSYAVVVFLVLSGFLIARSVHSRVARGTFTLWGYLLDRAVRLMTPLVPAVLLVMVGDRLFLGSSLYSQFVEVRLDAWTVISNLVFLQDNIVLRATDAALGSELSVRSLGSAAPWWTVAYEWWIYVVFGVVVSYVILARRSLLSLSVGAFGLASVIGVLLAGNALVLAWCVGLAYGWGRVGGSRRLHMALCLAAIIFLSTVLWLRPSDVYAPWTTMATGVAVLSGHRIVGKPNARWLRVLSWPASFSYSLYLTHFSLLVWLCAVVPEWVGWQRALVGVVAANVLAVAWWWAFERHYVGVRRILGRTGSGGLRGRTPRSPEVPAAIRRDPVD